MCSRRILIKPIITMLGVIIFLTGDCSAFDTFMFNPRAMGMGGAFVASVDDASAQYYNPAAFGFMGRTDASGKRLSVDNTNLGRKKWGVDVGAGGGYRVHKNLGRYLNDLSDIDIDELSQNGIQNESDLADLINLANDLEGLDDPGNAITMDVSGGGAARFNHFAIGSRLMFQASGRVVDLDTTNLGLNISAANLNDEINNVTLSNNDNQILLFTTDQQTQLANAGLDANAIQKLDYMARHEGVTQEEASQMVNILDDIVTITDASSGDLEDNTTTVLLKGFGVVEYPISYGYAFNDKIAVGGNAKFMKGRVYHTEVIVFDNDAGDVLKEADSQYKESSQFGLDLGVMVRIKKFNFGIVGRNLNSPSFDGPTVNGTTYDDVTIDPQITAGVAFIPLKNLKIEADMDLTSNKTALDEYRTQNFALGAEWDAVRFLAVRAGAYKNMKESDIGWVYTVGLGINFWAARLDVAYAFAGEKEQFKDENIPKEVRLAAQFSIDF